MVTKSRLIGKGKYLRIKKQPKIIIPIHQILPHLSPKLAQISSKLVNVSSNPLLSILVRV